MLIKLFEENEIDLDDILHGFNQIKDRIADITIDCPLAEINLSTYIIPEMKRLKFLPVEWNLV